MAEAEFEAAEAAAAAALRSRAEAGGGCCWFLLEATPSEAVDSLWMKKKKEFGLSSSSLFKGLADRLE